MSLGDALREAQKRGLDLIQLTEKVDPPVCKIGDFGKFQYLQEKKNREARKKERAGADQKEVRLSYKISEHDLETRARQASKFLAKGNPVRVTMKLRGREKALESHAREKMQRFLNAVGGEVPHKIDREVKLEPRGLSVVISRK